MDILRILLLLLVQLPEHLLCQYLGEPDNGVERSAQLVGHVRQELGFVLAGYFELTALLLNLTEEASVLNCDRRLGGEGLEHLDDFDRELAGTATSHCETAKDSPLAQQRKRKQCTCAGAQDGFAEPTFVRTRGRHVRDLYRLAGHRYSSQQALAFSEARRALQPDHLLVDILHGPQRELLGPFVVLVDRAAVGPRELDGARDDHAEHGV